MGSAIRPNSPNCNSAPNPILDNQVAAQTGPNLARNADAQLSRQAKNIVNADYVFLWMRQQQALNSPRFRESSHPQVETNYVLNVVIVSIITFTFQLNSEEAFSPSATFMDNAWSQVSFIPSPIPGTTCFSFLSRRGGSVPHFPSVRRYASNCANPRSHTFGVSFVF